MVVAAVIDGWKLKVPNWLTFPLILSGWALGLSHSLGWFEGPTGVGGLGASLAGTALGFALLFPVYAIGGMGAGDVKMQMGFGSWIGAFYGLSSTESHPGAMWILVWAFCLAALIGGVLALGMIFLRGQLRRNLSNTRAILGDLFGSAGVGEVAAKAAERKPRMHLLPYGIPLCLGFISYLVYLHGV
jgi:prepilin peptidase CpaA